MEFPTESVLIMHRIIIAVLFVIGFSNTSLSSDDFLVDCENIKSDERSCLACNIYHEARGEDRFGQYLVGLITLNRVENESFPNTFCEVVWQKIRNKWNKIVPMYSWTLDGRSDHVTAQQSWNNAYKLASIIIAIQNTDNVLAYDPTQGALCYHASTIERPKTWKKKWFRLKHNGHLVYDRC